MYTAKTICDYELDFTVWSGGNNCAAADMVCKKGSKVWGVVYEIPDYLIERESARKQGRKSLDEIEGSKYERKPIELEKEDGEIIKAQTYVVINKCKGLKTSYEYTKYIIDGLEEHEIPENYIEKVKHKIVENNPDLRPCFE
ncbi:MAG: gamma-glutamylcyclotransferase family protein [Nitrososphaeria archaeon]